MYKFWKADSNNVLYALRVMNVFEGKTMLWIMMLCWLLALCSFCQSREEKDPLLYDLRKPVFNI